MESYELALARREDIPECMEVLNSGREFQRAQGFVQWPDGYPPQSEIEEDVQNSEGYVLRAGGGVAAYLYIGFHGDPAYPDIRGAWRYDGPYAVIHRVAIGSKYRGKGLADVVFRLAGDFCISHGVHALRIDTAPQTSGCGTFWKRTALSAAARSSKTAATGWLTKSSFHKFAFRIANEKSCGKTAARRCKGCSMNFGNWMKIPLRS